MKVTFLPRTKLEKTSVFLFVGLVVFVAFFVVMVTVFDQRGGATFFSNPLLTIPMITAWMCGLASAVVGLRAIIKEKARSILLWLVVGLSLLTTLYGILEIFSSH